MTDQIDLDSLVGEHALDAVDLMPEGTGDAEAIRFRLDGIVYTATEDPDDGYRSCLKEITVSDAPMKNVFPSVKIEARKRTGGGYVSDVLELVDTITGKTVLEVGTDNTDDYYPWFVGAFWPENMALNAEERQP